MKVTPSVAKVGTGTLCVAGLLAISLWFAKHRKREETGHDTPDDLRPVVLSQEEQSFVGELARRVAIAEPGPELVSDPDMRRIAQLIEEYQAELRALGIEPVGNLSLRLTATLGGARGLDEVGLGQLEDILRKLAEQVPDSTPAEPARAHRRRLPHRNR